MVKIREVLRLQAEGHPQRKIAATVNCLCSTVQKLSNSACFMSGVRTKTIIGRDRLRIRKPPNYGAPGEIIRAARSPLRGRPSGVQRRSGAVLRGLRPLVVRFAADRRRATRVDVQLGRGRRSCRTPSGLRPLEFDLKCRMSRARKGFSCTEYNSAPGEIARGRRRSASASLRPAAALRASTSNLAADGQVVELCLFSVGSSNYREKWSRPGDGPRAAK